MKINLAKDLKDVHYGQNMYLTGLVCLRKINNEEYGVACESKCFIVSKKDVKQDDSIFGDIYIEGKVKNILGRVIAFELPEYKSKTFYFCVTAKDGYPILIFRKGEHTNICYMPKISTLTEKNIILGEEGYTSKYIYNIIKNISNNIKNPVVLNDFKRRLNNLSKAVNISNLAEKLKAEYIEKINRLRLFSRPLIFYSGIVDELEDEIHSEILLKKELSAV